MKLFLAIIALAATALICAWAEARALENELETEVSRAVRAAGFEGVVATVDGRDVLLEGTVPNVERKQQVARTVDAISGVGSLHNRVTIPTLTAEDAIMSEPVAVAGDCRQEILAAMASGKIDFESSSAELRESSGALLDRLAEIVSRCGVRRIEIVGHTDASGPRDDNLELSLRRAEAVLAYLVDAGVDRDRLTAVGYGPDRPLVSNETPEGRAVNRRIELVVQDPSS